MDISANNLETNSLALATNQLSKKIVSVVVNRGTTFLLSYDKHIRERSFVLITEILQH